MFAKKGTLISEWSLECVPYHVQHLHLARPGLHRMPMPGLQTHCGWLTNQPPWS